MDRFSNKSQNRAIFQIISCHKEYFGVTTSRSFTEAGHGKGPCDPIGSVAKRKADQVVKNGKYVVQDAITFFEWAKQDTSAIAFPYVCIEDYEISEKFLKVACENLQAVKGTMKVYVVFSLKANSIWARDTSCFCKNCSERLMLQRLARMFANNIDQEPQKKCIRKKLSPK